jgi:hypothetical protein
MTAVVSKDTQITDMFTKNFAKLERILVCDCPVFTYSSPVPVGIAVRQMETSASSSDKRVLLSSCKI